MATVNISLPAKTWVLVATGAEAGIISKNSDNNSVELAAAASLPSPSFEGHRMKDREKYVVTGGMNLYAKASDGATAVIKTAN